MVLVFSLSPLLAYAEEPMISADTEINIRFDSELYATVKFASSGRPVIYPIYGPGGVAMTRGFPFQDAGPFEKDDHDHQRSLWLTHGEVNGIDFWIDDPGSGIIEVKRFRSKTLTGGASAIVMENTWKSADGKPIVEEIRQWTFHKEKNSRRIIDTDTKWIAKYGDVHFGDTKEGTFGVRVPGIMKVDSKRGGRIVNAKGAKNKEAWGKRSPWVDYHGPINEKTKGGIRIHDHPKSFNYPCRWHVRNYGLFAANPFGVYHFEGGKPTDGVNLAAGESMRVSYRTIFYVGPYDEKQATADAKEFADSERPSLEKIDP